MFKSHRESEEGGVFEVIRSNLISIFYRGASCLDPTPRVSLGTGASATQPGPLLTQWLFEKKGVTAQPTHRHRRHRRYLCPALGLTRFAGPEEQGTWSGAGRF